MQCAGEVDLHTENEVITFGMYFMTSNFNYVQGVHLFPLELYMNFCLLKNYEEEERDHLWVSNIRFAWFGVRDGVY